MQLSLEGPEIIVALIGGTAAVLAPLLPVLVKRIRKTAPPADVQAEAIARTEAKPGIDQDTLIMAQRAMSIASEASRDQEAMSNRLCSAEEQLQEIRAELGTLRKSYRALFDWAHELIDRWHEIRHKDDPPPLPENIHRP